ncbi:MAG TPA: hypothetical protein VNK49_05245 [Anaerolineales bacterium]|nr:hypothetical protein [Anaerolineales bacterium]
MKHFRLLSAWFILTLVVLSCASPLQESGAPPSSSEDQVATIVASTMQALTPEAPTEEAPSSADLLPHSLYYLSNDAANLSQVFRLERDGRTITQITFESSSVNSYDVSPVDGSVAYVANNQLLLIRADGSERRLLVDGGPVDENNPFLSNITSPVFSLDGQSIAYGYKGLNFYSLATGASNLVIENQIEDLGSGLFVPRELYWPEKYSPDGQKLLISLGYYEGGSSAIYYPNGNALVRLNGGEGALICCGEPIWAYDSSAFYSASSTIGMFGSGMWKVDATTGNVTTLLPGDAGDGTFNFASDAYLAPDGQLYYFFVNYTPEQDMVSRAPLQLVKSAPDGVTGRTTLRSDNFQLMNEALWAPDAAFVLVAFAPLEEVYSGGRVEIVYLDGRSNVVLIPFAQKLKWGP